MSAHTAMLTQQRLGHSCVCQVRPLGLHSQLSQGEGPPRRLYGAPSPLGLETQVLDSELGGWVSRRLLLLMALPCSWGQLSPALLPVSPASGALGRPSTVPVLGSSLFEGAWLWVNPGQRQRPPRWMAWPAFFPSWVSLSPCIHLLLLSHI